MSRGVSIIICCFNSASRIKQTLRHIANQKQIEDINYEVILVDNASTDNTGLLAKTFWDADLKCLAPLQVVVENTPGLSNARKKGIETSNYEYAIFCDDDNWLDDDYVATAVQLFNRYTDAAILGGLGTPAFEDEDLKPVWFDRFYQSYAVGEQANGDSLTNSVYGAGMCVRKSVLNVILSKHTFLLNDRKKASLSSGGDTELCLAVRLSGFNILYSSKLKFQHFISRDRLNWTYLRRLHIGFAKTFVVTNLYLTALNSGKTHLPAFYWLKRGLYYLGIYIKYSLKYKRRVFSNNEINLITWRTIAWEYFSTNFNTLRFFAAVNRLKTN